MLDGLQSTSIREVIFGLNTLCPTPLIFNSTFLSFYFILTRLQNLSAFPLPLLLIHEHIFKFIRCIFPNDPYKLQLVLLNRCFNPQTFNKFTTSSQDKFRNNI